MAESPSVRSLEAKRKALAAEIEHLRIQKDKLEAGDVGGGSVDSAVADALERQRDDDHTVAQDERIEAIGKAIDSLATGVGGLTSEVHEMQTARAQETLVSEALAKALDEHRSNGLTAKRLYISVAAIFLPMVLTLTVVILRG